MDKPKYPPEEVFEVAMKLTGWVNDRFGDDLPSILAVYNMMLARAVGDRAKSGKAQKLFKKLAPTFFIRTAMLVRAHDTMAKKEGKKNVDR